MLTIPAMNNDRSRSAIIVCENVVKRFGKVVAVNGVSLTAGAGEFLTIFGPNGAGKTSLLKMMAGLARLTAGRITIDGLDINDHHDELRKRMGFISHQTFTYGRLTPMENLLFFAELYQVEKPVEKAKALLEQVGLSSRANDPTRTFSRGMLQRLSIARALIHEPGILFLDEPFTGLDQHASETLKRLLARLRNEDRTVIMITHNLELGLELATRVALQVAGSIHIDQPADRFDRDTFAEVYFNAVGKAHY